MLIGEVGTIGREGVILRFGGPGVEVLEDRFGGFEFRWRLLVQIVFAFHIFELNLFLYPFIKGNYLKLGGYLT